MMIDDIVFDKDGYCIAVKGITWGDTISNKQVLMSIVRNLVKGRDGPDPFGGYNAKDVELEPRQTKEDGKLTKVFYLKDDTDDEQEEA